MFLLLDCFILVFLVIIVIVLYIHLNSPRMKYKLPPGPTGLPILGNVFQVSEYPNVTYSKWKEEFGDFLYANYAGDHVFVMSDIQTIKECFCENVFTGRSERMLLDVISQGKNGILQSEGQVWVEQRRFTLRHLRHFGFGKNYMESLIMDEVNDFIEGLKKEGNNPVHISERFDIASINAIWMIVAGKKFKQDDHDKLELLKDIYREFATLTLASVVYLVAPALLKIAPGPLGFTTVTNVAGRLHKMLSEAIQEHIDNPPTDGVNARDLIDAFLIEIEETKDVNSSFYKKEGLKQLCAGIGDLFFAGSETTSTTLSWMMLYITVHHKVQAKLQEQIDSVTGKSRSVSLADRASLPYAEACILEILRHSSIAIIGIVHTATHRTTFRGYDIPKGSWLLGNQYSVHHDRKIWGDPENFRPERFLSEDQKTVIKNENLIPFSIGKRSCIGESLARDEIFLFMTNIFQRFSVIPDPTSPPPSLDARAGFLRKPQDFLVVLKDRLV